MGTTLTDDISTARERLAAGSLPEAAAAFRAAAARDPFDAAAWLGLAGVSWRRGDMAAAADAYRRAADLRADDPAPHSDYLHLLHYDPAYSPEDLFHTALQWAVRFDRAGELGVGNREVGGAYSNT